MVVLPYVEDARRLPRSPHRHLRRADGVAAHAGALVLADSTRGAWDHRLDEVLQAQVRPCRAPVGDPHHTGTDRKRITSPPRLRRLRSARAPAARPWGSSSPGRRSPSRGIGMSIAANKFPSVRAALVGDATAAGMAREHVDANVLVFGGGMTRKFHAHELLHIFL